MKKPNPKLLLTTKEVNETLNNRGLKLKFIGGPHSTEKVFRKRRKSFCDPIIFKTEKMHPAGRVFETPAL